MLVWVYGDALKTHRARSESGLTLTKLIPPGDQTLETLPSSAQATDVRNGPEHDHGIVDEARM
jgi:hypothetical protein